jgi:hypothetical protein
MLFQLLKIMITISEHKNHTRNYYKTSQSVAKYHKEMNKNVTEMFRLQFI